MHKYICLLLFPVYSLFCLNGAPTTLAPETAVKKAHEMLELHPSFKKLNVTLGKRLLQTYCDQIDAFKIYLLKREVSEFINASDDFVQKVINSFEVGNFEVFEKMLLTTQEAIARNRKLEERLLQADLPIVTKVNFREFTWADTEEELFDRLRTIRALQVDAARKLGVEMYETALQRLQKRKAKYEEAREVLDPAIFKKVVATFVIKAFAEALDSETAYFTPAEAMQLLINMQQRLFGIGVVLRDDVDGFTVVSIVEGGPAAQQGGLEVGDKVVAVDGEPVIGYDLVEVVELVRGEPQTFVTLKVLRKQKDIVSPLDVHLKRGKVVVQNLRYGTKIEPFQDGVIVCLKLHSFYQDDETSSYADLLAVLEKLQREYFVKGIILDLRYNPGGLLTQAVAVSGLFIDKGIVVSIQDGDKNLCHMRNLASKKAWTGPLVVLINRTSASASEIVAQALQDWGRAIIVGDDRSFGKGSFQLFTLCPDGLAVPNPEGEYKVTRGRYYTVSGKSPQLVGVVSDVVIPGELSASEIGEGFSKFPLPADTITPHFEDTLSDVSFYHRQLLQRVYASGREVKSAKWTKYLPEIKRMAEERLAKSDVYKNYLAEIKKNATNLSSNENSPQQDVQLEETWNVLKDLVNIAKEQEVTANAGH